jgi:predicted RNA binding protein YcfA (HicA-like mRNA interferase family)
MSDVHSYTPKELIKLLERKGFVLKRSKGSHHIYKHPFTKHQAVIPMNKKDLSKGIFYEILKQAGIDKDDL